MHRSFTLSAEPRTFKRDNKSFAKPEAAERADRESIAVVNGGLQRRRPHRINVKSGFEVHPVRIVIDQRWVSSQDHDTDLAFSLALQLPFCF
jgi:hypothetical protein